MRVLVGDADKERLETFACDMFPNEMPYHIWVEVLHMDGVMLSWNKEEI
jgi:hypothetical protein